LNTNPPGSEQVLSSPFGKFYQLDVNNWC